MKKINKISAVILSLALILGFTPLIPAHAATNPNLGAAATFSILAQTAITGTTFTALDGISGNVAMNSSGASIGALTPAMVAGTIYATDLAGPSEGTILASPYPTVQGDAVAARSAIIPGGGLIDEGGAAVPLELGGITRGPGIYTIAGNATLSGVLTLDGPGTYIFRNGPGFNFTSNPGGSISFINGARACDLFWGIGTSAEIGSPTFAGTILSSTGVHFNVAGTTLDGRALAIGADVTLNTTNISGPTCAAASSGGGQTYGWINVVKMVINDNGRTKTVGDFSLFVNDEFIASGITSRFGTSNTQAYEYKVTETADSQYTRTFSGDCDINGIVRLSPNDIKFCIITNDDIGAPVVVPPVPPLIDVVKVPSPLALPNGAGLVNYTYTLRNIGTVPVTDITMVGDTCSPIVRVSGDTNNDNKLDVTETWVHTCSKTITETHTNIVTATGWANGISATDIANATVIVGIPVVPPLIHVTKVPSPLVLSAGSGMVTYTNKVTNPGTVALSNVRLTDDKCSPVKYISGDVNSDSKLDATETWVYTCSAKLTKTTVNTITASGDANGLTVRDSAIATVVVAAPKLPNTGIGPDEKSIPWNIAIPAGIFTILTLFYFARRKQTA